MLVAFGDFWWEKTPIIDSTIASFIGLNASSLYV